MNYCIGRLVKESENVYLIERDGGIDYLQQIYRVSSVDLMRIKSQTTLLDYELLNRQFQFTVKKSWEYPKTLDWAINLCLMFPTDAEYIVDKHSSKSTS